MHSSQIFPLLSRCIWFGKYSVLGRYRQVDIFNDSIKWKGKQCTIYWYIKVLLSRIIWYWSSKLVAYIIWWMFECFVYEIKIIKDIFVECYKKWILNSRFFLFHCSLMFQKQRIFIQNSKTHFKRNKLKRSWWITAIFINNERIFNNKRWVYWFKNWMDIWSSMFYNKAKHILKLQLSS